MASNEELRTAFADATFRNRVEVAAVDAAYLVIAEADGTANHANRLAYAFRVVDQSERESERLLKVMLVKNKAATLANILAATDAALLTEAQALWNEFADHFAA